MTFLVLALALLCQLEGFAGWDDARLACIPIPDPPPVASDAH